MEIPLFCKSACNNRLQQSIFLCIRERCLKYGRWTNFGRAKVKGHTMMHIIPPKPMSLPSVNLLYLTESNNSPDKILKVMVTMTRSKVKSRSYHAFAHLEPPNQCPYRVSTSYTLWLPRCSQTRFYRSRSRLQCQRSNQSHIMTLQTYNPHPLSLPSITYIAWT